MQPKLAISDPLDKYEQEADTMAEQVTSMPEMPAQLRPSLRPSVPAQPQPQLHAKETSGQQPMMTDTLNSQVESMRHGGEPLSASTRAFFEPRLGHDLGHVRVHTDGRATESARAMNALAYTVGKDVVFKAGQYQPDTHAGRKLLAHELAHVVQQGAASKPFVQRKIDKITTSGCHITIKMGIGIYGPHASYKLAKQWQGWIRDLWGKDLPCSNSGNKCSVEMDVTVSSYSTARHWWQVPEDNQVYVVDYDKGLVIGHWGKWGKNEINLTIAHEAGHFMGLIDRYWQVGTQNSMPGFKHDIMGAYRKDKGGNTDDAVNFSNALSRMLWWRGKSCPCCETGSSGEQAGTAPADVTEGNEPPPAVAE